MTAAGGFGPHHRKTPFRFGYCLVPMLALALLLLAEPALANRLETIGNSFAGSPIIKRDWVFRFFVFTGGLSAFTGLLAILFPHAHASFLNYDNWKQSAAVLFSLAAGCFVGAVLI